MSCQSRGTFGDGAHLTLDAMLVGPTKGNLARSDVSSLGSCSRHPYQRAKLADRRAVMGERVDSRRVPV